MSASRLTPSDMFRFAFMRILNSLEKENKLDSDKLKVTPLSYREAVKFDCYGAKFSINDSQSVFLLKPACDLETHSPSISGGANLLSESLKWVSELQKKKNRQRSIFIIPLAECNFITGVSYVGRRKHWTFLVIQGKNVYFCDPKGAWSSSYFYSLEPIKRILSSAHYTLQSECYANWQAMLDDTLCGHHSGYLMGSIVAGLYKREEDLCAASLQKFCGVADGSSAQLVVAEYKSSLPINNGCYDQLRSYADGNSRVGFVDTEEDQSSVSEAERPASVLTEENSKDTPCGPCISTALFVGSVATIVIISLKGAAAILVSPLAIILITAAAITAAFTLSLLCYHGGKALGLFSKESQDHGSQGQRDRRVLSTVPHS